MTCALRNREQRQQVPLDHVAERFVGPHRPLIDDDPCGSPSAGAAVKPRTVRPPCSGLPSEVERRDPADAPIEHVIEAGRSGLVERGAAERVDIGGDAARPGSRR